MIQWLESKKLRQLYHGFLSVLASVGFVYACNAYFKLEINLLIILFLCIMFTTGILLFQTSKNKSFMFLMIVIVAAVFFMIGKLKGFSYSNQINKVYQWFLDYINKVEEINSFYCLLVIAVLCLIACIGFYLLSLNMKTRAFTVLLFGVILIRAVFIEATVPKLTAAIFLLYFGSIVTELSHYYCNQNKGEEYRNAAILLVPIVVIFAMIAAVLPASKEPIEWKGVKAAAAEVYSFFEEFSYWIQHNGEDDLYSLKSLGFEEGDGGLGGDVAPVDETMFYIKQSKKNKEPVYIRGAVKDLYSGRKWIYSDEDFVKDNDYSMDLMERIYYLYLSECKAVENIDLCSSLDLTVTFDGFRTKTIFYPINSRYIRLKATDGEHEFSNGNFLFEKSRKRNTEYDVNFLEWNINHPSLQEYLRSKDREEINDKTLKPDLWEANEIDTLFKQYFQTSHIQKKFFFTEISDKMKSRQENIEKQYLDLPENLPKRVYELAAQVTKDCGNDYDKLLAIQGYLRQYPYTLNPGGVPEDKDFVDYFLFEGQKGYCTYYASAMAVMSRCIGIPTRYVEGFLIKPDSKRNYTVLGSNAHSWTEVYLSGFGWIVMEATPGYGGSHGNWSTQTNMESANGQTYDAAPQIDVQPIDYNDVTGEETERKSPAWAVNATIIALLGGILIGFSVFIFKIERRKRKYSKSDVRERIRMDMKELLFYLLALHYHFKKNETVTSMIGQVKGLEGETKIAFTDCFYVFMKARYSDFEISEKESLLVSQVLKQTKQYVIQNESRIRTMVRQMQWVLQS